MGYLRKKGGEYTQRGEKNRILLFGHRAERKREGPLDSLKRGHNNRRFKRRNYVESVSPGSENYGL